MTDKVDPQIRRNSKLVPASVSHAHVQAEELIEALAALASSCESTRSVTVRSGPVIVQNYLPSSRRSNVQPGAQQSSAWWATAFFLRVARRRRQNRANRQTQMLPRRSGDRGMKAECIAFARQTSRAAKAGWRRVESTNPRGHAF